MLVGKKALVTGASKGIGKAIALELASLGADVAINYNSSKEEAEELVKEIEKMGRESFCVKANVSNLGEATQLIEEVKNKFGRIDILVNNAGITRDNLILRMKEEDFDEVIETNLKSVFNCTKAISKIMIKQKEGRIINIASVIGIIGNAGQSNYAASKAGIIGFSKSMAKELASRGITVNSIAPGYIQTDMTKDLPENVKNEILAQVPANRLGKAEDVAYIVGFLASDKSNYITGQVINVDGGMVML
ncbi:MAG: 3-oxoacyl-[acyl-carrier-protein] reductase [Peptostreptococcales bacterium]